MNAVRTMIALGIILTFVGYAPADPPACLGDFNGDHRRNISDLAQLLGNYGMTSGAQHEDGDMDADGDVDISDLAALLGVYGTLCPGVALPGQDCWLTECGNTQHDFSEYPIPADFFGPGSDPFDGVIALSSATGYVDTIIERMGTMVFDESLPSTDQVEIEIVELSLVSCEPITVITDFVEVQWDVQVDLSPIPAPPGTLAATKTHANGGTYTSVFHVQPRYTFTRVDPPHDIRVWDTGAEGIPPIQFETVGDVPWLHDETYEVCTIDGFAAGVQEDPASGEPCGIEVCHADPGPANHQHCMWPPAAPACADIPPGQDCWLTECGNSRHDFWEYPIPADFFEPGSEPFDGVVALGSATGYIDTIIERMDAMVFPQPLPSTDEVEIEIIELNLVSCEPITVITDFIDVQWDVQVDLSPTPAPPGTLAATKTHENGGTYTSVFHVQPRYTFTRVDPPHDIRVWDTGAEGIPPIQFESVGDVPWLHDETYEVCTFDNFAAGAMVDPYGEPCGVEVCHTYPGPANHQHCMRPPAHPACP